MTYTEFKEVVAAAAKKAGLQDYELYCVEDEAVTISAYQMEVESFSNTIDSGVCFRCIVNGRMGYASTELFDEEQAEELVRRAVENAKTIENSDPVFLHGAGDTYKEVPSFTETLPTAEEAIPFLLDCQRQTYDADPRVCDGTVSSFSAMRTTTRLTNSRGLDLENTSGFHFGYIQPVMEEGGEKFTSLDYRVGRLASMDSAELAKSAVKETAGTIGAEIAESGKYTIVLSPDTTASLLDIFADVFTSDNAQKGLSLLKGKEGEKIAADCVTLIDDPFCEDSFIQVSFDAEGVATRTKNVVENGILKTLLYNLSTAAKENRESTGNAFKASCASSVEIAPYSFYLKPGEITKEELLRQVGTGIYITEMNGGHAGANAVTGDFSLQSAGFLIEDGELGRPVHGFTVADNFFELLKKITCVAGDLKFTIPSGFTVFGGSSVAVTDVSIAGK